ncbi:MAG: MHS family MFS transporter [Chloroflexi bacterium]|nr:MHS family MFS transporter [Chloroflexota bacterium]
MPTIVTASSAGTMIEWYDFYLYGSLAAFFGANFFPTGNPTASLLASLATFGAGFAVRPLGAIVFGHVGDLVGRKYSFLVTISVMGLGTFLIGCMPTYAQIGIAAPLILVLLRLLQGLALGGEYGGAAIYVAEHAPDHRRGFFTSWIQTTATIGLALAYLIITVTRVAMPSADFNSYGWRIPFFISAILVAVALYVRWRLRETPLFSRLKEEGRTSTSPVVDSLGSGRNWGLILLALFGFTAGEAVVWYTGQFYSISWLQSAMKVDFVSANIVGISALIVGTPLFLLWGHLSDRIGRKPIMMAGFILAAVTYYPIYQAMAAFSKPVNLPMLSLLVFVQMVYVTMVYAPIAAFLIELFPARIRYTSMSVPYHLGNGWFGGFLPLIATSVVAGTANIYAGLLFPIIVALVSFVVAFFAKETKDVRIWDEVDHPHVDTQPSQAVPGIRPATA